MGYNRRWDEDLDGINPMSGRFSAFLNRDPKRGFASLLVLFGFLLSVVGAVVPAILPWGITVIFFGIAIAALLYSQRCPACGRWGARHFIGREQLSKSGGYMTVQRTSQTRNSDGSTSTTTYPEQIHVIHYTHQNHFECRYCSHHWSTIKSSTVEG